MIIIHACNMIMGHVSSPIGLMFDTIQSDAPGGEASWESKTVWGAEAPQWGDGRGGTVNGFGGKIPSRGMVKVGLMHCLSPIVVAAKL